MIFADVCIPCRANLHDECIAGFSLELDPGAPCCCDGQYDLAEHVVEMILEDPMRQLSAGDRDDMPGQPHTPKPPKAPKAKGDPGYIHPDAWPSTANLGALRDPESTGRKRVAEMYQPFPVGLVCEWAGLRHAGGGLIPIIGCLGNPASDLHHGPDKNTLNNAKASLGIGDTENVHRVCSSCHNSWHGQNDRTYPKYDRVDQQAEPWLPDGPVLDHDGDTMAPTDLLYEVNRKRDGESRKDDRRNRGRQSPELAPDRTVRDDD